MPGLEDPGLNQQERKMRTKIRWGGREKAEI
jgi:hypothetical protein